MPLPARAGTNRSASVVPKFLSWTTALMAAVVIGAAPRSPAAAYGQEGVFLSEEQAPAAVFAEADKFSRRVIPVSPELRSQIQQQMGITKPSITEDAYVSFIASRGDQVLGYAVIVEEIGKHRPITFVVGIRLDGHVNDVAVMAYREAYGGEIKAKRFLTQYRDKSAADSLQPPADIKNVAGATLSVEAASRAVKKALAVSALAFSAPMPTPPTREETH